MDITFRIGALRITVQGPLDLCVDAQRRIADCFGADSPPPASSVPSGFSFVNPPPTASASHQAPATEAGPSVPESRSDVVASFPPLPNRWASLTGQLHSASSSGASRLARAWVAGHWARATLEGRVPSPSHSPVLKIPPSITWCCVHRLFSSLCLYPRPEPILTWWEGLSTPLPSRAASPRSWRRKCTVTRLALTFRRGDESFRGTRFFPELACAARPRLARRGRRPAGGRSQGSLSSQASRWLAPCSTGPFLR